jgi:hypothetical protein
MRRWIRNNGLSLVTFVLFFATFLLGQTVAGMHHYNENQKEHGKPPVSYTAYLTTNDFLEATFENWESEFLQLFTYVLLTSFLYQKGSAESKDPDQPGEGEQKPPEETEKIPWPVRRGGLILKIYEHSLSLTFFSLFIACVLAHAASGAGAYNDEQRDHGQPGQVSMWGYMLTSTFWFESLQNWQSEFLAVFAMVMLSIWLREKGSAESKDVAAPHSKTGK